MSATPAAQQPQRACLRCSTIARTADAHCPYCGGSYRRRSILPAITALLVAAVLGVLAYLVEPDWRWLVGAGLSLANWPYTLVMVMPTNKRLMATPAEATDADVRRLIEAWGRLHAVRSALGAAATLTFLWAAL